MADLGTHYAIGGTLTIPFQAKASTGAHVDADSVPTYQVYEQGGTTAIASLPAAAKRDDANTTGYYEAVVPLTTALGFEAGKTYNVRKLAVIGGVTVPAIDTFAIANAGQTSFSGIAGWPTLLDVQARLSEMGLTAPSDDTIEAQIAAAVGAWEKMTNYEPFLGSGNDETRYLTADTCLIDFGGGITAVPTSLTINGTYDDNGDYQNGTALVRNRDYILMPQNALAKGLPFTYCKLVRYRVLGREGAVKIVASFGYAETVPALAWEAVMRCILALLMPQQMISVSGGLERVSEFDATEHYGAQGPVPTATRYFEDYCMSAVRKYRRIGVM